MIRGPSGSGKSDLALRCLAMPQNALFPSITRLVADDQVMIDRTGDKITARAPVTTAGKLEVRGLGIVPVEAAPEALPVCLVVDLVIGQVDRLPDPWPQTNLLGVLVPLLNLRPFEASAPHKIILALTRPDLPFEG